MRACTGLHARDTFFCILSKGYGEKKLGTGRASSGCGDGSCGGTSAGAEEGGGGMVISSAM